MKLIYTQENRILVENAKNILQQAGLHIAVKNGYTAGGAGDLSPADTWLELWVADEEYESAQVLLAPLNEPVPTSAWLCAHCDEENAATFDVCWQCQSDRPSA